jgi:2-dehydro-3-deoxyphosphooctonate aldolase (KDO 8-P synthase)
LKEGLRILQRIKDEIGVPVLSDVHCQEEIPAAREVLDVLQIPAFLCRQTDFVFAVAQAGKAVNIKKGQFLAPGDMQNVIEKASSVGNDNILLTERGTSFGYHNLVVDMRSFLIMRTFGCPIVFDATHSVQLPGGQGIASGGQREFVPGLARAAVAVGVDAVYLEVHQDPDRALCDGPNSLALNQVKSLLADLRKIDDVLKVRDEIP